DSVDLQTLVAIGDLAFRTYQENKFADAGALAKGILEKAPPIPEDPKAPNSEEIQTLRAQALNLEGVCAFAVQDFEAANLLLGAADKDKMLIPELGGQYLDSAAKYVDYWKTEQALRQKEDSAPEAQQLPRVELDTTRGKIVLELFENEAPNTVANF